MVSTDANGERFVRGYPLQARAEQEARTLENLREREIHQMQLRLNQNRIPLNQADAFRRELATTKTRRFVVVPVLLQQEA